MAKERKIVIFILVMLSTAVAINFIGTNTNNKTSEELIAARIKEKSKVFDLAPHSTSTEALKSNSKVTLLYFFTSTCSNCDAETPHINAWFEKYKNDGLRVIGIKTPEFAFEKSAEDLASVTSRLKITFPIINDSDFSIWKVYKNSFWPRVYLIDSDNFIIYDHIGEGAYAQTEDKIRSALSEANSKPITSSSVDTDTSIPQIPSTTDTYFGFGRNDKLGNGEYFIQSIQKLKIPDDTEPNKLYLAGSWDFKREYVENKYSNAQILLKYSAKEVYLVAGSVTENEIKVDNDSNSTSLKVFSSGLYKLVSNADSNKHVLKITIKNPGLRAYVLRFR